eukprot:TRINITY_DN11297_c0_g1_i1.p1 TRINITY_DN11297_c0_g1~~TRINITY_DN11297_c0_g1_i1.p1  ORF type:complete len:533 (-),score=108.44 TRINITY_DN11297_c0_g1_i1:184-1782(-)
MNSTHWDLAKGLINPNYALQAQQARNSRAKAITDLLSQRRLPKKGWDEDLIQHFIDELAAADTNNFEGNVGVGEREGRVICDLVRRRHFGLTHGIGRSGDVMAEQPKAAGSSLIVQLTRYLALDAIHLAGIKAVKSCCVLPAATGLSMTLVMLALRQIRPQGRYVIWSRIDQKSCFKAFSAAGLETKVVELRPIEGTDGLGTDVEGIRRAVEAVGAENVLCIATTTSTFAPRVPDSVDEVAILAKALAVPHVVNNAYGLQCTKCTHLIETGCRKGRIDAIVQSTDKNFLVPVGGALVCAPDSTVIDKVSSIYPGRASMSPVLDLFITLLSLGSTGWLALLKDRKDKMVWFAKEFAARAEKHGLRLLNVKSNTISLACDLNPLIRLAEESPVAKEGQATDADHLTFLGSALFTRRVSGPRVVLCAASSAAGGGSGAAADGAAAAATAAEETYTDVPGPYPVKIKGSYVKAIDGHSFQSYGAHADTYPCCYLTAACALGSTGPELELFLDRFDEAVQDYKNGAAGKKDKAKAKK